MRSMHKILSILAAGVIALGSTAGVYADPAIYDTSGSYGPAFSTDESSATKVYPGDSIVGTNVYIVNDEGQNAVAPNNALGDGTQCWTNKTGTVYTVSPSESTVEETETDGSGNVVLDEYGSPIVNSYTDYILNPYGGTVEVAYGTSEGENKDTSYSPDTSITYSDASGTQTVSGGDINTAAYQTGTQVTVSHNTDDTSQVFQTWTLWKVGDNNTLSDISEDSDTLLKLGISSLTADPLTVTAADLDSRVIFIPVFTQQEAAPEEEAALEEAAQAEGAEVTDEGTDIDENNPEAANDGIDEDNPEAVDNGENLNQNDGGEEIADVSSDGGENVSDSGENVQQDDGVIVIGGDQNDESSDDLNAAGEDDDDEFIVSDSFPGDEDNDTAYSDTGDQTQTQASDQEQQAVYTIYIKYVDPILLSDSDWYRTYPGSNFPVDISTAETDANGLVFSGWTADDTSVVFGDAGSASTTLSIANGTEVTESRTITITANYAEPENAAQDITVIPVSPETPESVTDIQETVPETPESVTETQETVPETPESVTETQVTETQAPEEVYTLTVQNATITDVSEVDINDDGSETASVEDGEVVTIEADDAPEGQVFSNWDVTSYNSDGEEEGTAVVTSDITQPTLEITVTGASVTAEPVYAAAEVPETVTTETPAPAVTETSHTLTVNVSDDQGGSVTVGSETTQNGTVALTEAGGSIQVAATPYAGYEFSGWTLSSDDTGAVISPDSTALAVTFTMGYSDVTLTAQFTQITHSLTITNGTSEDGSTTVTLAEGESADIEADDIEGYRFSYWSVTQGTGTVDDESSESAVFTMGTDDAAVSAVYVRVYTLAVTKGSADSTTLAEGESATLTADDPDEGYRFKSWEVTGSGSVANASSASTTFTMGAADANVTATYEPIRYTLTVTNGTGDGEYIVGELVDIEPDFPASGKEFDCWTTTKGSVTYDDAYEYYATVTMKAQDATVEAVYKDGPSPDSNQITGLENGGEYLKSTTLTFTAVGAGMDNSDPNPGDYRYRPTGYQIGGVSGTWSSSPYQTSMAINAAGDYTLTVTYARDVFDGSSWNADGTTVSRSITFHVVNNLSVETGDSTPLAPLIAVACAAVAVIIVLIVVLMRRRKH